MGYRLSDRIGFQTTEYLIYSGLPTPWLFECRRLSVLVFHFLIIAHLKPKLTSAKLNASLAFGRYNSLLKRK